ncbi:hypothetical protein ES705_45312 [subsurface metagenome]
MKDHYMLKLFIVEKEGKPVFRICPVFHPRSEPEDELGDFLSGRGSEYQTMTSILDIKEDCDLLKKEIKNVIKKFNKTGIVKPTKIIPIGTKGYKGRLRKRGDINDLNERFRR